MKTSTRILCFAPALAFPLLAFSLRGDEVSFHPADGSSVSKELKFSSTFYLDDLSVVMDGQELPPEMLGGMMEEGLLIDASGGVTDQYVSTKGGKVQTLLRTFDSLALEGGPESGAESMDEFGGLEGETIKFAWDEESGEYVKSFHESEGDEDQLENLEVDMDMLELLPKGEVSEGDTWEVKGEGLAHVFLPGGMPASPDAGEGGPEAEEIGELIKEEIGAQLAEAFEAFAIRCTYKGTRDDGDVKVGVIEFEFEGDAAMDLSDMIQTLIDLQGGDMGVEADITASIDMELEGKGTLLWDMAAGHIQNCEMTGEMTMMVDIEADIEAQGESHTGELSAELSSEMSWGMSASGE